MAVSAVAMRYVKALFAVSEKSGERAAVLSHLDSLATLFGANPELRSALRDPRVVAEAKRRILDSVGLSDAPQALKDFVDLCLKRGRAEVVLEAPEEFQRLEREARGILVATIESVAPLSDDTRGAIKARLEEMTSKHVDLVEKIEPSLLGGVRIQIGSTRWDGSVRRRLDDIELYLGAQASN